MDYVARRHSDKSIVIRPQPALNSHRPSFPSQVPPPHIPSFLVAFPDAHTYQETPDLPRPDPEPAARHQVVMETQQEAERALVKLHARATPGDPVLAQALPDDERPAEARAAASDAWAAGPVSGAVSVQAPAFPPEPEAMDEDVAGTRAPIADALPEQPRPLEDPAARARVLASLAPAFQPWDWQVELSGIAAAFQNPMCVELGR